MRKPVRVLTTAAVTLGALIAVARLVRPVRGRGPAVRAKYLWGRLHGAWHALFGPSPEYVTDATLADRVRSELGPLEKRLDVPHLNVAACGRDVTLHGVVGTSDDAEALVAATLRVPGVGCVDSHLHVGIPDSDTRPSEGHLVYRPSPMLERLLIAVQKASGNGAAAAYPTLRAVMATLFELLPDDERAHFVQHLPEDVRVLGAGAGAGAGAGKRRRIEHIGAFAEQVATRGAVDSGHAERVVEAVFAELRRLVPEEVYDVAAVLPRDLKGVWRHSMAV